MTADDKENRQESEPETVVCKAIRGSDATAILRGAAEMAQLDGTASPNVVRLIGLVTKGSPLMLLLEFCDHGPLDRFLAHRIGMSTADKMAVLTAVADGMAELESRGFVHGNLSCRNVLVAEGG